MRAVGLRHFVEGSTRNEVGARCLPVPGSETMHSHCSKSEVEEESRCRRSSGGEACLKYRRGLIFDGKVCNNFEKNVRIRSILGRSRGISGRNSRSRLNPREILNSTNTSPGCIVLYYQSNVGNDQVDSRFRKSDGYGHS